MSSSVVDADSSVGGSGTPHSSVLLLIVNSFVALVYLGVAAATNVLFVRRVDALIAERAERRRNPPHRASRINITSSGTLRNPSNNHNSYNNNSGTVGSGAAAAAAPTIQRNTLATGSAGVGGAAVGTTSSSSQALLPPHNTVSSPLDSGGAVFAHDYVSWFLILIIVFSLARAVAVVLATMLLAHHSNVFGVGKDGRQTQDLITLPGSILFVFVGVMLVNTFFYMSDAAVARPLWVYRLRLGLSFIVMGLWTVTGFVLEATHLVDDGLEYAMMVADGIMAVAFILSGCVIPRKVAPYGQLLEDLARKVRTVSVILCFSFLARSAILCPPVQNRLGVFGNWGLTFFLPFDLLPTGAALFLLHHRGRGGGGATASDDGYYSSSADDDADDDHYR